MDLEKHDTLDDIMEQTDPEESPLEQTSIGQKLKSAVVNSATGIIFYTPVMFAYETIVGGYSVEESAEIRKDAAVIGIALYAAYEPFRRFISWLTRTTKESTKKRKAIVESAAAYAFNFLVYAGILLANDATLPEAAATAGGGTVFVGLTGRPYGYMLDKVRNFFKLPTTYD